jgi:chorismate dehydratase
MNVEKIKISIVNYTNTLPFKWALKKSDLMERMDLQEDIPSICGQKLKFGQVDLALMPVAMLSELDTFFIESDFCIGANGPVDSVKLYSPVPLEQIDTVTLDYQSRSSITLTKVLFKFFWKKDVHYAEAMPGFEQQISGRNAAVVIGDRTFPMNGTFAHEYDLAQEWKTFTGLPFVFAAWISRERLPAEFMNAFNAVLKHGTDHILEAVKDHGPVKNLSEAKTIEYLTKRIDYRLDAEKRRALDLFLEYIRKL